MKFDVNNRLAAECLINGTSISAKSTLFNANELQNHLWITEGHFQISMPLEREQAINLIETLSQHLENIKANELELIALSLKAAA